MAKKTKGADTTKKPARKVGRPLLYTPEALETKFEEYIKYTNDNPLKKDVPSKIGPMTLEVKRPTTIVGFCVFAGIGRKTLLEYEGKDEFVNIITRVRETIEADQLEGAIASIYDSSIVSRVLRLADRQDVTTNGKDVNDAFPASICLSYKGQTVELKSDDI